MKAEDRDWDVCGYCGCDGCESGTAVHADDCPSETGVFPVREDELYERTVCEKCGHRNFIGMGCCRCAHQFAVGESFHHIEIEPQVYEVVCAGCAAQEAFSSDQEGGRR